MRYFILIGTLLALTVAASATTDIVGPFGSQSGIYGFTGRFPIVGRVGPGSGGGGGCTGTIDLSTGCTQPMLGGL